MKIQPVTLGLVVFAGLLGGYVYFSEVRRSSQPEAADTQAQKLFGFEEKQVQSFKVTTQLRSLSFERSQGKWQMLSPEKAVAADASVAYLLNLLATARSDRVLTATADDRKSFGLNQPMATISVTLDDRSTHTLILGGYDFNRSQVYAQTDPATNTATNTATEVKVFVVSPDFDTAVNRPLAEWKASPVPTPNTSTPSLIPSTTPSTSITPTPTSTP